MFATLLGSFCIETRGQDLAIYLSWVATYHPGLCVSCNTSLQAYHSPPPTPSKSNPTVIFRPGVEVHHERRILSCTCQEKERRMGRRGCCNHGPCAWSLLPLTPSRWVGNNKLRGKNSSDSCLVRKFRIEMFRGLQMVGGEFWHSKTFKGVRNFRGWKLGREVVLEVYQTCISNRVLPVIRHHYVEWSDKWLYVNKWNKCTCGQTWVRLSVIRSD